MNKRWNEGFFVLFLVISTLFFLIPSILVSSENTSSILLSPEEKAWLEQNPDKLVLYYNVEFPPIEFQSDEGVFVGMGADVIQRIEEILGVSFLKVPSTDWMEHLRALETGECAIAPTIVRTEERERYAFFTDPYATVPVVLLSTYQIPGRVSLNTLANKRIGVVSGYATEQYIRDRALTYRYEVVTVPNVPEGLKDLSFGQIDIYVENLAVAAYFIDQMGIPNLRVAGETDYFFAWSIGISRHYPLLYSSIQKALGQIPALELETIRKRWIALDVYSGIDEETLQIIWISIGFALGLIGSLVCITLLLKRRLKKKMDELKKNEEQYKRLIENAPAIVYQFVMKEDGSFGFSYMNENCEEVTGVSYEELMRDSDSLIERIHPEDQERFLEKLKESARTLQPYHAVLRLRKTTEYIWLEFKSTPEKAADGSVIWDGFLSDITQRVQAEEEVRESKKMLQLVMDSIPQHVFWKDQDLRYLGCNRNFARAKGLTSPRSIIGKTDYDLSLDPKEAETFRAYDKKILQTGNPQYHIIERQLQRDGKQAWLDTNKVPLFDPTGKVIGILGTYEDITERKLSEKALYESQELLRKQQGKFQKDLLMSMIQILELYDLYTKGHSENVARYSSMIAERIRNDAEWIRRVYWAGLVHDIGKLLIPTNVLNKVSRLTQEEYESIKMHPVWGSKVLSTSEQLRDIGQYVLYHHERFDGLGYPSGIKGKEIPLASRIIAVADAYDAMTSLRAYREPYPIDFARQEMLKGAGSQFDPEIIDIFFSLGLEAQEI